MAEFKKSELDLTRRKAIKAGLGTIALGSAGWLAQGVQRAAAAESARGEVAVWHWETPPERVRYFGRLGQQFSKQTGVKFAQVPINFPDYHTKIIAAAGAGKLPEILFVNPPEMTLLLEHKLVLPLDELYADLNRRNRYFKPANDYNTQGHQWSIPLFGVTWPLIYRRDLHEQAGFSGAPQTWDDLLKRAAKMHSARTPGFYLPVSTNGNYGNQVVWGFLRSNGANIVAVKNGKEEIVFNSPETVETYEFLKELAQYTGPGVENTDWGSTELLIRSGKIQTAVYNGAPIGKLAEDDEALALKYAMALVPRRSLAKPPQNSGYLRAAMVTTAAKERGNLDAATSWLRWVSTPDNHAELLLANRCLFMPPDVASSASATWTKDSFNRKFKPLVDAQVECMEHISVQGFASGAKSLKSASIEGSRLTAQVLQKIVLAKMPVKDAVVWGHGKYEEILRQS